MSYIIAVLGGKGGVGKSQVAVNLAFTYAQELKTKVLLLDFDQKAAGDQNILTGMKSPKSIKDLSEFAGAIDPKSIMPFLANSPSNVSYIGMPATPEQSQQIDVEGLGKTLKTLPKIFPLTVIDLGSDLTPLAVKALEYSTMILLVVTPDTLAVNQTKKMYNDLVTMLFPKDMIQVIINQFVPGHPINADVIAKSIKPALGALPKDEKGCLEAMMKSRPLITINKASPFVAGLVNFVRTLAAKNILKTLAALNKPEGAGTVPTSGGASDSGVSGEDKNKKAWLDLKTRIHKSLAEEMSVGQSTNSNDPKEQIIMKEQTKKKVVELLGKEDTKALLKSREDMNQIVKEILDEALGLGPLEDMLSDKTISEIMVIGPFKIYYEQSGKIKLSSVVFTNERQVRNVIERIVAPIGRRIDEKTPYVDARLRDGSRVHAIIPPCAIDGSTITIRKFPDKRLTHKDLVKYNSMTDNMADFLRIAVEGHRNLIVSGGTGSGKTTLINVLGSFIQSNERIITCEDSAELNFPQEHVVRLETRPPSLEGDGEIDIRCLVKQTLRMRPDRIVVGECRGGETLDMLQAMGTGHEGSMTTVHSNNPRECIGRLETLVQYAGTGLSPKAIKEMIASSVHLIVQQSRIDDGSRKVMYITEVQGIQGETVTLQDVFLFVAKGINKQGKVEGEFQATGFIPKFIEKLEKKGINIPRTLFK